MSLNSSEAFFCGLTQLDVMPQTADANEFDSWADLVKAIVPSWGGDGPLLNQA